MSKLDDIIAQKAYELDCLMAYRTIEVSGDCNTCVARKDCEYVPKAGQLVRYNCPHYTKLTEAAHSEGGDLISYLEKLRISLDPDRRTTASYNNGVNDTIQAVKEYLGLD